MILALALGCSSDGSGAGFGGTSVEAGALCDADGSSAVDLPAAGALAVLALSGDLALEVLGATPTWRGDLRGLELDDQGVPLSDGQIPAAGGPDGLAMVQVGWQTTWCAGDREVELTASATEATATCRMAVEPCGGAHAERPELDASDAIAMIGAASWSWHAVLFQRRDAMPTMLAWRVLWHEGKTQPFAFVDAKTGAVLPCEGDAADGCRDLSN